MKRVSVVIPNLNSDHICHTIESIFNQSGSEIDIRIIVVGLDKHKLIPSHDKVHFISTEKAVSAARARNIGARAAQSETVCFIDADCLATRGWIEGLTQCFEQGYKVVGGSVSLTGRNYWGVCDNIASFLPTLSFMPAGEKAYLPSLNLAISRQVFWEVGGFDEDFPGAAGEDVDLSFRLRRLGYKLYFEPKAMVIHNHGRLDAKSVWQHLFRFGEVLMLLHARFPDMKKSTIRVRLAKRFPYLFLVSTPLVAISEVITFYSKTRKMFQYWYTIPGLFWCKLALHNGIAKSIRKNDKL
jgi:GT2 family glycosyltransferase